VALRLLIAGGGISGLSLAYLLRGRSDLDIMLLEAEERPGGKIWSDRADGFLCEWGVNGFLDNKPKTLELASLLSLEPLRSSDLARKRYIYSGGSLKRLPETPPAFLRTGLMSPASKLRIALEPFIPRGRKEDESLADFARRRLGREALENFIDPMASGIYAGDPEVLSLKSCFPRIHEMEQQYGSLIKAMIKLTAKRRKSVGAGPGGTLTSFRDGMQALIDALHGALGGVVHTKSRAVSIERLSGGYALTLSDGSRLEADAVVLAVPAHQGAGILRDLEPGVAGVLEDIPYPAVTVLCTGFRRENVQGDLGAFGFLVPYREKRKILGTLYDSSVFENRAPEGHVLLRTMVGGQRAPELALQEDAKLLDMVLSELKGVLTIRGEPDLVRIYRHEQAIPQYTLGHQERCRAVEAVTERHPGLYITGNAFGGISVNDCIANSYRLAEKIVAEVL
jgi:oxygen-dependent protoporphyrinogen oxidase